MNWQNRNFDDPCEFDAAMTESILGLRYKGWNVVEPDKLSVWVCKQHLEYWLNESESPTGSDPSVYLHKKLHYEVLNGERFERARRLVGPVGVSKNPLEQPNSLHAYSRAVAAKAVEILGGHVACCCMVTDEFWTDILRSFKTLHGIRER